MFGGNVKRQKAFGLFFCLFFGFHYVNTAYAGAYLVVDVDREAVLSKEHAFQRWYPASLTKLMTVYLAFDALRRGRFNVYSPVYISNHAKAVAPTLSSYKAGSYVPFITAIQLVLVHSTNDLAVALAETIAGSEKEFVKQMNVVAQEIGMSRSHFVNPHGLFNKEHYSTAYDLALLAVQLRKEFPQYAHLFKIEGLAMPDSQRIVKNSNNLLGRFPGADGLKTGFTCASGYNLAASATRDNRNLVAIVLGAETIEDREVLTAKLLSEGFANNTASIQNLRALKAKGNESQLNEAANMRALACGKEARKRNYPYIKFKQKAVFPSPYLAREPKLTNIVDVKNFVQKEETLAEPM